MKSVAGIFCAVGFASIGLVTSFIVAVEK